jgi:hypothetical protein
MANWSGGMTDRTDHVDSDSRGDASRHLTLDELDQKLEALSAAPADSGSVALIVRRTELGGRREVVARSPLSVQRGVPGDKWDWGSKRKPEAQITVMQTGVATLIANGQPLSLFGDQLFVDLDISKENLPLGTQLRIGNAIVEVTPKPHNGCEKFAARFGAAALRFVNKPDTRHRNLRGIYVRVIEDGEAAAGDRVEVLDRCSAATHAALPPTTGLEPSV